MPVIARYAAATVPPMLLLILAATAWGGFAWLALIWLTLVAALADRLLEPPKLAPADDETLAWSTVLPVALACGHGLVLLSTTSALASATLTFGQSIALFFATVSFFGQVSHPNAHELIHRSSSALRALGAAVYTSVAFGHHVSAHRLVHHRHVGTPADPNTPLPGEPFWAYLPRAWRGSFEAGIECEIERLEHKDHGPNHITNPYWIWIGGAIFTLALVILVAGFAGALFFVALSMFTGAQILLSDYVQHYGLQRLILPSNRYEPVGPHHSWNAPKGFSSYLMMNAPSHSEHHMHPARPYESLDPEANVPTLPFSMPIMGCIAMVPPVWFRMMDRRALKVMEAVEAAHQRQQAGQVPTTRTHRQMDASAPEGEPSPTRALEPQTAAASTNTAPAKPREIPAMPSKTRFASGAAPQPIHPNELREHMTPEQSPAPRSTAPEARPTDATDQQTQETDVADLLRKIRAATQ